MNLRADREAAGMSQGALAQVTGINQAKLSRIENGHVEANAAETALIQSVLKPPPNMPIQVFDLGETDYSDEPIRGPHLQPYPAAPADLLGRQGWVATRNRNMQRVGVKAPEGASHGMPPKKAKA